ncbi:MAG TPA: Hsp33 family molecular chaperone HslO [Polyangia bacterium]|nr:Hsp33 family molecular chaperone HslO [Polyangia bacterium]
MTEPEDAARDDGEDEILRATVGGGAARVVAVTATGVAREAIRRHDATGAAAVVLARGVTAGLLLATLTKDEERVTLQLLGDGPLGGVTVDATATGTARAFVKRLEALPALPPERPRLGGALGETGVVSVVRDLGLRESFRGQTAFATGEVDEDCERYLTDSEQIESALRCETVLAADGTLAFAAGLLVQALPGGRGAAVVAAARERLAAGALGAALSRSTSGDVPRDPGTLVEEALGDAIGAWQALDARPVRFHCPCSRERAGAALALLGTAELADMILEDGKAEVTCNFCRARHDFTEAELERIRRDLEGSAGPPS